MCCVLSILLTAYTLLSCMYCFQPMMTHVLVMFVKTKDLVLLDVTATSVVADLATQDIDAMVCFNLGLTNETKI